jgi:hypothetical protein
METPPAVLFIRISYDDVAGSGSGKKIDIRF